MYNYGWSLEYILTLTKEQIFLFSDKINHRESEHYKFITKVHGVYKPQGLDTDGAIAIEDMMKYSNRF